MDAFGDNAESDLHYGRFDPRFLGLTLYFENLHDFNVMVTYLRTHGFATEHPSRREILTVSTLDHELRHFADFLASSYSANLFRMRLMAAINGIQAITTMGKLPGNVVPVPFGRWQAMSPHERRSQVALWEHELSHVINVIDLDQLPHHGCSDDVTRLPAHLHLTEVAYSQIDDLVGGSEHVSRDGYSSIQNVHEVSAFTTQMLSVFAQGDLDKFKEMISLARSGKAGWSRLWEDCFVLAWHWEATNRDGRERSDLLFSAIRRVQAIASWALLGNYQLVKGDANPVRRLQNLIAVSKEDPSDPRWYFTTGDSKELAQAWDYWDQRTGSASWRDCLKEILRHSDRGLLRYQEAVENWSTPVSQTCLLALSAVRDYQRRMIPLLLDQPALYADPVEFIINIRKWPAPPLRVQFPDPGVSVAAVPPQFEAVGWSSRDINTANVFVANPGDLGQNSLTTIQVLAVEELIHECDFVFSRILQPPTVQRRVRDLLGRSLPKKMILRML